MAELFDPKSVHVLDEIRLVQHVDYTYRRLICYIQDAVQSDASVVRRFWAVPRKK
jgi:hypothetical protein